MQENQLIHEFQKNANEKIKAEFCEYRGREMFNLRVYFQSDNSELKWLPTRKGITLSTSHIPELKEAMDKAYKQWEKKTKK